MKFLTFLVVSLGVISLSGCSALPGAPSSSGDASGAPTEKPGSVLKTVDNGESFSYKVTIDEKRWITADVLSMAFDPLDTRIVYIGTMKNGIFKTMNGGESWEIVSFPPEKAYGLVVDPRNRDRLYATGVYEGKGRIYKTEDGGQKWDEIYVEPGKNFISLLSISRDAPDTLYAATDAGVIVKTSDGGKSWRNVVNAKGPVTKMILRGDQVAMALVHEREVIRTKNGGGVWETVPIEDKADAAGKGSSGVEEPQKTAQQPVSLASDPSHPGTVYIGAMNGIFRSVDGGTTWKLVRVIDSSRGFSIRGMAVNSKNPDELVYAAGSVLYRSTDGGVNWSTKDLRIDRAVSLIEYDSYDPSTFYVVLRKI